VANEGDRVAWGTKKEGTLKVRRGRAVEHPMLVVGDVLWAYPRVKFPRELARKGTSLRIKPGRQRESGGGEREARRG